VGGIDSHDQTLPRAIYLLNECQQKEKLYLNQAVLQCLYFPYWRLPIKKGSISLVQIAAELLDAGGSFEGIDSGTIE
jgi:hypothetical protein